MSSNQVCLAHEVKTFSDFKTGNIDVSFDNVPDSRRFGPLPQEV